MKSLKFLKRFYTHFPKKKVLGISGSPRAGGNTDVMLEYALSEISDISGGDIETDIIYLRNLSFNHCIGCEMCRRDKICTQHEDDMTDLYSDVIEAQCLLLGSPTHNYNITVQMKSFIDRLYCFYDFEDTIPRAYSSRLAEQNRLCGVVAVCEQVDKSEMGFTVEAMEDPMVPLGYEIVTPSVKCFGIFGKAKVKEEKDVINECKILGEKIVVRMI